MLWPQCFLLPAVALLWSGDYRGRGFRAATCLPLVLFGNWSIAMWVHVRERAGETVSVCVCACVRTRARVWKYTKVWHSADWTWRCVNIFAMNFGHVTRQPANLQQLFSVSQELLLGLGLAWLVTRFMALKNHLEIWRLIWRWINCGLERSSTLSALLDSFKG